jgi:divalent metal cation (Fe/Co/Zn/Cd) transporter
MIYCTKCCAFLHSAGEREDSRRVEDECFGIPGRSSVASLVFGIIIILVGFSLFIQEVYDIAIPWWPLIIVLFGTLVIIGALYGFRRRY